MLSGIHSQDATFLSNLNRIESRISKVNQQVTSGTRVSQASDDPSAVSPILLYQGHIDQLTQTQTNLTVATSDAAAADSALQSATTVLDQISSLGSQGLTLSADATSRTILAQQVQQLQSQLVSIANTSVRGNYIFGGDSPNAAPYSNDPNSPNGIVSTSSAVSTRVLSDGQGSTRPASLTASQIFDTRNLPGSNAVLTDAALTATPALDSTANPGVAQTFTFQIQGQSALLTVSVPGIPGGYTTQAALIGAVQTALNTSLGAGSPALASGSVTAGVDSFSHLQFKSSSLAFTVIDNGADDTAHDAPAGITATGNPAPDNTFAAVGSLSVALLNNDPAGVQTALSSLKIASSHLQSAGAFYGNVENWITSATSNASSQITNLTTALSSVRDTDLASAITQMTTDKTALEASISAHASLSTKTLFDYLG